MTANKSSPLKQISIRTRLLFLLTSLTALAILSSILMTIITARQTGYKAESVSSNVIRSQLISSLEQLNQRTARENDQMLEQTANNAQFVAEYLSDVYSGKYIYKVYELSDPVSKLKKGKDGQHLNNKEEISSLFVPSYQPIDSAVLQDIKSSAFLDIIFKPVFDNNPNIKAIYFASPQNVVRYYPNINLGNVVPPDFTATERPWYQVAVQNATFPAKAWWTPVYMDATGLGVITTAAVPVFGKNKEILGVVGFDITITDMVKSIELAMVLESGYSFLVDNQGNAIALPSQGYQDILNRLPKDQEFGTNLLESSNEFKPIIQEMIEGKKGIKEIDINKRKLLIAYSPLSNPGWSLGSVVDAQQILLPVTELNASINENVQSLIVSLILPISLIIFITVILLGLVLTNLLTAPIQKLAVAAESLGHGNWTIELPHTAPDEIGTFAVVFQKMAAQIREMVTTLEDKVNQRTSDLKRRAVQLQAAIEVGHAVASERDLDHLLSMVTHLISERFGFYHVGIFLLDPKGEYAYLRAANSEGGERMLKRHHHLKVNEQGIVGYVTGTSQPRIALNVGEDAVFFNNPDLPHTKSEMALPLIANQKILGALDIQSEQENAFTEEDIAVLGGMADLIAVAIQNAQLFSDYERAIETTRRAYGEKSAHAWSEMIDRRGIYSVLSTAFQDFTVLENPDPTIIELIKNRDSHQIIGQNLLCPIWVKGHLLGVIRLKKREKEKDWTNQEIIIYQSIANRIGAALESARLYEQSVKKAERERLVSEIGSKLRSSNQPEKILQIAVQELRRVLHATQAQVEYSSANSGAELNSKEGVE